MGFMYGLFPHYHVRNRTKLDSAQSRTAQFGSFQHVNKNPKHRYTHPNNVNIFFNYLITQHLVYVLNIYLKSIETVSIIA